MSWQTEESIFSTVYHIFHHYLTVFRLKSAFNYSENGLYRLRRLNAECGFYKVTHHCRRRCIPRLELMSVNPGKRFGLDSSIDIDKPANLAVWNLNEKYTVDPDSFLTMGRATPFAGMEVYGQCMMTMVKGEIKWKQN